MNIPIDKKLKDLYEAAFLYCLGVKLLRVEQEKDYCLFVFENGVETEKYINDYWNRQGQIVAKDYSDSVKTLKSIIFSKQKGA